MFSYLNPLPQLPNYRGPFRVGSCEYEIPVSELRSSAVAPNPELTTIKFRIFYPTTRDASSTQSIPWLPTPQKEWNRAYCKFLGFGDRSSAFLANAPSFLSHPEIPAVQNAPLLSHPDSRRWPVAIFSHGLGGNQNAYSSFVGSLASCGMVVFAPEHRDASCPVSFIRDGSKTTLRPVPYRRLSHNPSVEVLNERNAMLRTRLWELDLLYTAISGLQDGQRYPNFADTAADSMPQLSRTLDLSVSKVSWLGHSFGSATVVQLIKSIYYRKDAPSTNLSSKYDAEGWDWTPLYVAQEDNPVTKQVTADSPMALLDVWTMPLTAKTTKWLWEKPLPCYARAASAQSRSKTSNVISIMSSQFYKWKPMINSTRALLSQEPAKTYDRLMTESGTDLGAEPSAMDPVPQKLPNPITKLENSKVSGAALDIDAGTTSQQSRQTLQASGPSATRDAVMSFQRDLSRTPSPAPSTTSRLTDGDAPRSDASSMTTVDSAGPNTPPKQLTDAISKSAPEIQLVRPSDVIATIIRTPELQAAPGSQPLTSPASLHDSSDGKPHEPRLYLVPFSAHLSQSDFGPLFPTMTKYMLKAQDPDKTMELNVRAVLAMIRGQGIDVALHPFEDALQQGETVNETTSAQESHSWWSWGSVAPSVRRTKEAKELVDNILIDGAMVGERWERVAIHE